MSDEFLTTHDVAATCHVTVRTVRFWIRSGVLAATRLNRSRRALVPRAELQRLLAANLKATEAA